MLKAIHLGWLSLFNTFQIVFVSTSFFHMSNIRKSKKHEDMPNFDEMWGEVQEETQEKDAVDAVVNRAPELRTFSENIDKATNT